MRLAEWFRSSMVLLTTLTASCGSDPAAPQESTDDPSAGGNVLAGSGGNASDGNASGGATGGQSASGTGGQPSVAGAGGAGGTGGATSKDGGNDGLGGSPSGVGGTRLTGCTSEAGAAIVATPGGPSSQAPGTWKNVTPAEVDLGAPWGGQFTVGAITVLVDPARPSDVYLNVTARGTWKSTDYGASWKKASTGANADKVATGSQWYAAIDSNPCRDPATAPAIYVTQGYGSLGIWKSTDGAVSWTSVWNNNIFAADGVTNISSDVGGDIHSIHIVDPTHSDHLIVTPHGYFGNQGNIGYYESTDGGKKWILHKTTQFVFSPHSYIFWPFDAKTWSVSPGTISSSLNGYRTTDGGATWNDLGAQSARNFGRVTTRSASTTYSGTDYTDSVWKTADRGATWTKMQGSGGKVSWVATTATKIYASDGMPGQQTVIRHADLANPSSWVSDMPSGMMDNGIGAGVTFDGSHYVLIVGQATAGAWRYVEP